MREPALSRVAPYNSARLSPDGGRIVAEIGAANNALWIADLRRDDVLTRITFHGDAYFARWTPDGSRIAYTVGNTIRETAIDGSGRDELLVDGHDRAVAPTDWSPNGRTLVFQQVNPNHGGDILLFDRETRQVTPLLATTYNEGSAQFSPDGRWLAYVSDESGRPEIYMRPLGRDVGRIQVSPHGATGFAWNPRGGEIVYRQEDTFFAVPITLGDPPSIGAPVRLFAAPDSTSAIASFGFGLSADGQRVLLREDIVAPSIQRFEIFVNWFQELRTR